jgi:hypothetical protein
LTNPFVASGAMAIIEGASTSHSCVNTVATECSFNQAQTGYPNITAVAKTAGTLTFTGTGFFANSYNVTAKLSGVEAESVTVAQDGLSAVATFSKGVPVTTSPQKPQLYFTNQANATVFHSNIGNVTVNNSILITAASANLQCSFAGGCEYEVHAAGLSALMKQDNNQHYVKVRDEKCVYNDNSSSATIAKCKIPKLSTLYSDANFNISTMTEDLKPPRKWGTLNNNSVPFDGVLVTKPVEGSMVGGLCSIGVSFKVGHVAMLRQVKWFLGDITNKAIYEGITKF